MKSVIVIPARYQSTRYPGKPLAMINGKSLLQRTWSIAKAVKRDEVFVTTDERIEKNMRRILAPRHHDTEQCEMALSEFM